MGRKPCFGVATFSVPTACRWFVATQARVREGRGRRLGWCLPVLAVLAIVLSCLLVSTALVPQVAQADPGIIYVDDSAAGSNNGSSWENAFNYLQDGLSAAVSGDDIRVGAGIYLPDRDSANPGGTGDVNATFMLKTGVDIYGGYAGAGAADPDARDFTAYETILSGELNPGDAADPHSNHVVSSQSVSGIVIDGLTIALGQKNIYAGGQPGGGMYNVASSLVVTNCVIRDNWASIGAGMYNDSANVTVANSTFDNNDVCGGTIPGGGGGMSNVNSNVYVANCTFSNNSSGSQSFGGTGGGGIANSGGNTTVVDSTFAGNHAYGAGGGTWNVQTVERCVFTGNSASVSFEGMGGAVYGATTVTNCGFFSNGASSTKLRSHGGAVSHTASVTNCVFSGNVADHGGAVDDSTAVTNCAFIGNWAYFTLESVIADGGAVLGVSTVTNCIFRENYAGNEEASELNQAAFVDSLTYCDIQGGWAGAGNIDADPLFVDADGPDNDLGTADDNLRISAGSPCIDAGNSYAVPAGIITDLDGFSRFVDDPATPDTGVGAPVVDMGGNEIQSGVAPLVVSCDLAGFPRDQSAWGQTVCIKGTGLQPNTAYKIWIQDDPVAEGDALAVAEDPSGAQEDVITDASGSFGPVGIWTIAIASGVTYKPYDIVVDKQGDGGNTGVCNAGSDGIDSMAAVGFAAPVPEVTTLILLGIGLFTLVGVVVAKKRRAAGA